MKSLVIAFCVLIYASANAQNLYKWKDDRGQWYLSTTPPPGGESADALAIQESVEPVQEVPCASFKPGESRKANSYYRGSSAPLQMIDLRVKRLESERGTGYYSWKAMMHNFSNQPVIAGGTVKLRDCSEFLIAEANLPKRRFPPYGTVTVDGKETIEGPPTETVGRFSVTIGDTAGTDR